MDADEPMSIFTDFGNKRKPEFFRDMNLVFTKLYL